MTLKYILDRNGNFAIFSEVQEHFAMSRDFYQKPVSAGFCRISAVNGASLKEPIGCLPKLEVECFGHSASLNLDSREQDSKIISDRMNGVIEDY